MKFEFKAKDAQGEIREGYVEALDSQAAATLLEKNGLIPIFLQEEKKSFIVAKIFGKLWQGISQKELMIFFQQLATLIEARVPIVSSLITISDQTENRYLDRK